LTNLADLSNDKQAALLTPAGSTAVMMMMMMMMIVDLYSTLRRAPLLRYMSQCIVKRNVFIADRKDLMLSYVSRMTKKHSKLGPIDIVLGLYIKGYR